VTLSSDEVARFADLLKVHEEALVAAWTDEIAGTLRGRLSHGELQRQTLELQRGFQAALSAGVRDLDGDGAAELRAHLSELSSNRARQGFTVTETAVSVFALKAALLKILDGCDATTLRDYIEFSSFVDRAALFTVDTYVRTREELISDQATGSPYARPAAGTRSWSATDSGTAGSRRRRPRKRYAGSPRSQPHRRLRSWRRCTVPSGTPAASRSPSLSWTATRLASAMPGSATSPARSSCPTAAAAAWSRCPASRVIRNGRSGSTSTLSRREPWC
jgi:hypothetical protein